MDPETRQLGQALGDNAIALRQLSQTCQWLVVGVGVHLGDKLDGAHTNGGGAGDPQGATGGLSGACISRKVLRSMSDLSENPGPTEPEYCQ